jgi:outer membrane immunogenic protein
MKLWRSSLLALTVSAGIAGGASLAAADGPARGGEFPNIPWNSWTGLYGGVHLGNIDAWWDDGLVGGVQLGKNWQTGKVVYGIEGDISVSGADTVDWLGTVRGRLGYLLTPGVLAYGTAGVGLVNFGNHHGSDTNTEFVAGVGVETKLTQATTVRLEYLNLTDSDIDIIRVGVNWKLNW